MGRITVRDLARTARGRVRVVSADRASSGPRVAGVERVTVDVSAPASLARALRGATAVVASLPYRHNLEAMRGALRAGAHYVDLGGLFHVTRRQLALAGAFRRRGLMAILGMGSAPGILNVMAVRGARGMETVREVHCLVGAADRTRFRHAPPLGFGYAPDTLLDEFAMPSAVFRRGRFAMVPPLDPRERVLVRFPSPVGPLPVHSTLHSEVATLPLHFADRGIREVTFRQGFDPVFMARIEFLVALGLIGTEPLAVRNGRSTARVSPREVLLSLLRRFPPAAPVGRPWRYEVLRTVVRGRRDGRAVTVTCDCHAGPRAGWGTGPDIDTGAPPSIAVQLLLNGEIPLRPGVWSPEQVVPVEPFIRELKRRGMRVTVRTAGDRR
jgi:saccharopine dehydrogenase-like NADP-dependent oxidoreductase